MEQTKIQRWGNSLAVRLPRAITQNLRFKEGSSVLVAQEGGTVMIKSAPERVTSAKLWKQFLIPTKRKKRANVSGNVDTIVYGVSR